VIAWADSPSGRGKRLTIRQGSVAAPQLLGKIAIDRRGASGSNGPNPSRVRVQTKHGDQQGRIPKAASFLLDSLGVNALVS
jgi:hypothetical protein